MSVLLPKDTIDAAIGAYAIEGPGSDAEQKFSIYENLTDKFSFSKNGRFESVTGAFLLKSKSGFGVIARGKGRFSGDVLIALRGTASALDWLTDGNTGIQLSGTGKIVHAGFNRVFKEFEPDLRRYFSANTPARVHCVGHSLGGALAGLTADWLSHNNIAQPYLYTFGSPRIGFKPFADRLTQQVGKENIFRVHHNNDVVSLVPVWPFVHVPQPGMSCCLQNHGYNMISAHYKENYSKSVKNITEWGEIKIPAVEESSDLEIKNWLSMDTVNVLSTATLNMIGSAIRLILKASGIAAQLIAIGGITVLDQLSYALDRAIQTSKDVATLVGLLMKKILSMIGKTISATANITIEFIRWVLNLLMTAVNGMVNMALSVLD
ncbi:MAG: lipase family protein [Gammaproteobacteria bacterium]|nr:lipase family protein [Gammaproteobacteria bacterium]